MENGDVTDQVAAAEQHHVLGWLEGMPADARRRLLGWLAQVDFARVKELAALIGAARAETDFSRIAPAHVARLPATEAERSREHQVIAAGRAALAADRVAVVTAAGGQGTRLKFDGPKGAYPITPVLGKSLFQLFAEKILAARRRYGCRLPWFIMTGRDNDEATRRFFDEHGFFGLGAESVHFFVQGTLPILDAAGRLLVDEHGDLLAGPDGHGGAVEALSASGALDAMEGSGFDLMSYFQVDNPLVTVADPRFVGYHLRAGAEFSCKVVAKRAPEEGLGLAVLRDGRPAVIEYVDVPPEVAAQRDDAGRLRFLYGSIAIHAINVAFLRRLVREGVPLPWHVAEKEYVVGSDGARIVQPVRITCFKFERFIFDSLPWASGCAFVEVNREHEFAPVKNAEGEDSPDSARRMMQRVWAGCTGPAKDEL